MAANTTPIYTGTPDVQSVTSMSTANNTADITSGTIFLCFTADATNGGFVREIRIKANPANNTQASVCRAWINNGAATANSSNSALFTEIGVPATTASAVNAQPDFIMPINYALPASYRIYLTWGTSAGGSGSWSATAFAGKY